MEKSGGRYGLCSKGRGILRTAILLHYRGARMMTSKLVAPCDRMESL
jgi:hypothetical protein